MRRPSQAPGRQRDDARQRDDDARDGDPAVPRCRPAALTDDQPEVLAQREVLVGDRPLERSRILSLGSTTPTATGSACASRAATSRSLQTRKPARVAVRSTAFDHLCRSASALVARKRCTTDAQLLQHLRRHQLAQQLEVLADGLREVGLDLELRLHQLQRRQEHDLELGDRRHDGAASARSDRGRMNVSFLPMT